MTAWSEGHLLTQRHDGTVRVAVVPPRSFEVRAVVRTTGDAVEAADGVAGGRRRRAVRFLAAGVHDRELPGCRVGALVGDC